MRNNVDLEALVATPGRNLHASVGYSVPVQDRFLFLAKAMVISCPCSRDVWSKAEAWCVSVVS